MTDMASLAWLDQDDARISHMIRRFGWSVESVEPCSDECPHGPQPGAACRTSIAYTVGLFGMGHPELLVCGLNMHNAVAALNDVGERVRGGADLVPGELLTFADWPHRMMSEVVPNPGEIVFGVNRHYQRPAEASAPVLQLTYDDVNGKFPWDEGYSIPAWIQPRPGTFTA